MNRTKDQVFVLRQEGVGPPVQRVAGMRTYIAVSDDGIVEPDHEPIVGVGLFRPEAPGIPASEFVERADDDPPGLQFQALPGCERGDARR